MTDACQASTHSPMAGAPSTEGYGTPSVTVTRPASRGPVTRAAVSASLLSPERDVIGPCELWPYRQSREGPLGNQHEKPSSECNYGKGTLNE